MGGRGIGDEDLHTGGFSTDGTRTARVKGHNSMPSPWMTWAATIRIPEKNVQAQLVGAHGRLRVHLRGILNHAMGCPAPIEPGFGNVELDPAGG